MAPTWSDPPRIVITSDESKLVHRGGIEIVVGIKRHPAAAYDSRTKPKLLRASADVDAHKQCSLTVCAVARIDFPRSVFVRKEAERRCNDQGHYKKRLSTVNESESSIGDDFQRSERYHTFDRVLTVSNDSRR